MSDKSTIAVRKPTKERLRKFGFLGNTYDELLNELMDHINTCDMWWYKRYD